MNPIQYALNTMMKGNIPKQILNYAFQRTRSRNGVRMHSMEQEIRSVIIDERVLPDIGLRSGTELRIPLNACRCEQVDRLTYVYYVEPHQTQNRTINQVTSVSLGNGSWSDYAVGYNNSVGGYAGGSTMGRETGALVDASMGPTVISTGDLNLVGHNAVMVRFTSAFGRNLILTCRVADDDQLTSIRPTVFPEFAQLVIAATKSYLYNNLIIEIDEGLLQGGQQLGAFRDELSNYSTAEETYQQLLSEWRQISMYNDPTQRRRHRQSTIRRY